MNEAPENIHATAIVVGSAGLLFMGESGAGKSECAFACLHEAARQGLFAALVADDQVLVTHRGNAVLAEAPQSTKGLLELRGSGLVRLSNLPRAVMHLVVQVGALGAHPRLPKERERCSLGRAGELPLMRLQTRLSVLAAIAAACPHLPGLWTMRSRCDGSGDEIGLALPV